MVSNLLNNSTSSETSNNNGRIFGGITKVFADVVGTVNKGLRMIEHVPVASLFLPNVFTAATAGTHSVEAGLRKVGTDLSDGRGIQIADATREAAATGVEKAADGFIPFIGDSTGKAVTKGIGLRDEQRQPSPVKANIPAKIGGMN